MLLQKGWTTVLQVFEYCILTSLSGRNIYIILKNLFPKVFFKYNISKLLNFFLNLVILEISMRDIV